MLETVNLTLRLIPAMHAYYSEWAKREHRSLQSQLMWALEQMMRQDQQHSSPQGDSDA